MDAYRLSAPELDDLQLDEEAADCVTVVEWGRGKVDGWAADQLLVVFRLTSDDPVAPREVTLHGVGRRWADAQWPQVLPAGEDGV